jgi:hypothetical protein
MYWKWFWNWRCAIWNTITEFAWSLTRVRMYLWGHLAWWLMLMWTKTVSEMKHHAVIYGEVKVPIVILNETRENVEFTSVWQVKILVGMLTVLTKVIVVSVSLYGQLPQYYPKVCHDHWFRSNSYLLLADHSHNRRYTNWDVDSAINK